MNELKSDQDVSFKELVERFANPPRDFSPVPIWWWSGERLERERLRWQLEQFAAGGVFNLVVLNLAPTGPLYGSDADDPAFLSEEWWQIFRGMCADARQLGVCIWFYDQIGFSGANLQADLVRAAPAFSGQWLACAVVEGEGRLTVECPSAGEPLAAAITDLRTGATTTVTLVGRQTTSEGVGPRRLRLIYAIRRGFDYFSAQACAKLLDTVHGEFERRVSDFFGDVIVGSFQDELPSLPTWGAGFLEAFRKQTGYDLSDHLGLLWEGEDPQAQRVRADYHAVRASLAEEAFFKPLFDWHERHGLMCGFDQQGPARSGDPDAAVQIYADYLRTHRWFAVPGSDHHGEAKIHSSLAHLYDRPRTWIEAFHSSGWGGTLEETFDWLVPWLRAGANLYDPHAVYYSTRGGWWEWAPPSTCWRQPYWRHYPLFAGAVSRLCYLLSQGDHICDIGVLYPTTTVQAFTTPDGLLPAGQTASDTYLALVGRMIWFNLHPGVLDTDRRDYDVLDDGSLQRATVMDGAIVIGAERYRTIVLPDCAALDPASAQALCRFVESGGRLIAIGALPAVAAGTDQEPVQRLRALFDAGKAIRIGRAEDLPGALADLPRRVDAPVPTLQRRIGGHDVLFIPATFPRATQMDNRRNWSDIHYTFDPQRYPRLMKVRLMNVQGVPQLWDPLTGSRRTLQAHMAGDTIEIDVPFEDGPAALLVWGEAEPELPAAIPQPTDIHLETLANWQAQPEPTLDNRYGDFDRPKHTGAPAVQTWRFEHRLELPGEVEAPWQPVEATFGIYGWWIGPLSHEKLPPPASQLADSLGSPGWQPARYSLARGISHDTIHRSTLGPKGHVPYEFLAFGQATPGESVRFRTTVWLVEETHSFLALGAAAAKRAWVNGASLGAGSAGYLWITPVTLRAGQNLLEWELTAEQPVYLRAAWALVRDPDRFRRPEWLTIASEPVRDSRVRFTKDFEIPFASAEGTFHVGTALPCRSLINGIETGRQGGFDPYGFHMRVQRYTSRAFRQGTNTVLVEVDDPGFPITLFFDLAVRGANGEQLLVSSGPDWRVQRDEDPWVPAALRRLQGGSGPAGELVAAMDPPTTDLHRRPHPLPGAMWIEDTPADDTVVPVVPDAFVQQERAEWFHWMLPPGVTRIYLPLYGAAQVWIDGTELPIHNGSVAIPPSQTRPRIALMRVVPEKGRSEGGIFAGPVTYEIGQGPFELGNWAEHGLEAYSGGLRYKSSFTLRAAPEGTLVLDLGRVRGTAEVWVNGRGIGARVWSPYRFDITAAAQEGLNHVEVLICNTLGPYLNAVSPTHFISTSQAVSGLFGPVVVCQR